MGATTATNYLTDILHVVSQALLIPTVLLLLLLICYGLFCIGSIIVEFFTERTHFKVTMPQFLAALMSAEQDEIPAVIERSGLLNRQKIALLTVYDYRTLPGDALMALIRRLIDEEEGRYDRISSRNNMAARISPMIGLMGTLIPLGPGIEALGRADTEALSSSLLVAFDTTVAGLVVAAVCLVIGKIRTVWYENYMSALDGAMATMLEKIEDMRAKGQIQTQTPSDYAFLFAQSRGKGATEDAKVAQEHAEQQIAMMPEGNADPSQASSAAAGIAAAAAAEATLDAVQEVTPEDVPAVEADLEGGEGSQADVLIDEALKPIDSDGAEWQPFTGIPAVNAEDESVADGEQPALQSDTEAVEQAEAAVEEAVQPAVETAVEEVQQLEAQAEAGVEEAAGIVEAVHPEAAAVEAVQPVVADVVEAADVEAVQPDVAQPETEIAAEAAAELEAEVEAQNALPTEVDPQSDEQAHASALEEARAEAQARARAEVELRDAAQEHKISPEPTENATSETNAE